MERRPRGHRERRGEIQLVEEVGVERSEVEGDGVRASVGLDPLREVAPLLRSGHAAPGAHDVGVIRRVGGPPSVVSYPSTRLQTRSEKPHIVCAYEAHHDHALRRARGRGRTRSPPTADVGLAGDPRSAYSTPGCRDQHATSASIRRAWRERDADDGARYRGDPGRRMGA